MTASLDTIAVFVPTFMFKDISEKFYQPFRKAGRRINSTRGVKIDNFNWDGEIVEAQQLVIETKNQQVLEQIAIYADALARASFMDYFSVREILSAAKKHFAKFPDYVSKGNATSEKRSSADYIGDILESKDYELVDETVVDEYREFVYAKSNGKTTNEIFVKAHYETGSKGVLSKIRKDRIGVSVYGAYVFWVSKEEVFKPSQQHKAVGTVGQRFNEVEVKCLHISTHSAINAYTHKYEDRHYYRFEGPDGSTLEYSGSVKIEAAVGDTIVLSFAIKKTPIVKGVIQNIITRIKVHNGTNKICA